VSHPQNGLELVVDFDMPANNRLLVFVLSHAAIDLVQMYRLPQLHPAE
jgi:hypothetical protein